MSSFRGSRIVYSEVIGDETAPVAVVLKTEKEKITLEGGFGPLKVTVGPLPPQTRRDSRGIVSVQDALNKGVVDKLKKDAKSVDTDTHEA